MSLSEHLYEILGIDVSATQSEIKKAYAKKLREFPVEENPEQFQQIRRAYEVLGDEKAREDYDKTLRSNGKYGKDIDYAILLINEERYQKALEVLEGMKKDFPHDKGVRYHVSICYLNLARFNEAKTVLLELSAEEPNSTDFQHVLARAYVESKDWSSAVKAYEKLIQIDSEETNYHLELSYCYTEQQQFQSAAGVLEKKLRSKGKETIHDFPLLSELYFLALIQNQFGYCAEILSRIKSLPGNSEEKQQLLMMLINLCSTIENNVHALNELNQLIKTINQNEFEEVTSWLNENRQAVEQVAVSRNETAATYAASAEASPVRGNIGLAIVIGIVLSFFTTPIGGIIAGFVYYFFAESIKNILKFLGCFVLIILVIVFIVAVSK